MNRHYASSNYKFIALILVISAALLACQLTSPVTIAATQESIVEGSIPVALPTATEFELVQTQPTTQALPPAPAQEVLLIPVPELVEEQITLVDLYARVNPSVVNITSYIEEDGQIVPNSQGSGFLYDADGHIVTNAHVVHGSQQVDVAFADITILNATVIGEDLHSDLAVLKVDSSPEGVFPVQLGDMNNVVVGQTVVAIGNPFGLGGSLTRGIVSALGRTIPALTTFSIPQSIQTDAAINPGNSGGPLLNLNGEVIGVNAQIQTDGLSRSNQGVGFAIPVSIVKRVVPVLIEQGEFDWAWLGVRGGDLDPSISLAMGLSVQQGAYMSDIIQGGPADKAGLRGATGTERVQGRVASVGGDVIIAIDGQPVSSFDDLLIYIALKSSPGKEVVLTILRNGSEREITVTLEPRPESLEFLFP